MARSRSMYARKDLRCCPGAKRPITEDTFQISLGWRVVLRLQTPCAIRESAGRASSFSAVVTGREKVISPLLAIGSVFVSAQ